MGINDNIDDIPSSEESSIVDPTNDNEENNESNNNEPTPPTTIELTFSKEQPKDYDWFSSKEYIVFQHELDAAKKSSMIILKEC